MAELTLFNAQDKVELSQGYMEALEKFLREVMKAEEQDGRQLPPQINLILVDNDYIAQLNEKYLGREGPTDVLSFELDDVAEIYVSAEYEPESIHHFALHGLLHVLGYDHKVESDAREMRQKEGTYLKLWSSPR